MGNCVLVTMVGRLAPLLVALFASPPLAERMFVFSMLPVPPEEGSSSSEESSETSSEAEAPDPPPSPADVWSLVPDQTLVHRPDEFLTASLASRTDATSLVHCGILCGRDPGCAGVNFDETEGGLCELVSDVSSTEEIPELRAQSRAFVVASAEVSTTEPEDISRPPCPEHFQYYRTDDSELCLGKTPSHYSWDHGAEACGRLLLGAIPLVVPSLDFIRTVRNLGYAHWTGVRRDNNIGTDAGGSAVPVYDAYRTDTGLTIGCELMAERQETRNCAESHPVLCETAALGPAGCPAGWSGLFTFCYLLEETPLPWMAARQRCHSLTALLASPRQWRELALIRQAKILQGDPVWSGWNDLEEQGVWRSADGRLGQPAYYTAEERDGWAEGQPTGGDGEDCVELSREGAVDRRCTDRLPYICQRPIPVMEEGDE